MQLPHPRVPTRLGLALAVFATTAAPAAAQSKSIPVTIRDFSQSHPDFESPQCYGGKNMVQPVLDADRKPFHTAADMCPDNQLKEWFRDAPSNTRYCQDLTLNHKTGTENTFEYNSDLFFPIDAVPTKEASIPGEDGKQHNFHFCMEMHAAFKYRGGEVFDFKGDDDVWVYINRKIGLDLGGVHTPQSGSVDLDAMKTQLGITPGNYYDFDFFFCERQTIGSHLWLKTSIYIIPPPAPGYHIADADLNLLRTGDTVEVAEGSGPHIFKAAGIATQNQTIDCSDVSSQVKTLVDVDWTLNGVALPHGNQASVDTDTKASGTYLLKLGKNGLKDSVWVRIRPMPAVAKPAANPPGGEFTGSLDVTLATATSGAAIHYTLDGSQPLETSPLYVGPINLTGDAVLRAFAVKPGMRPSPTISEAYTRRLARAVRGWYQDHDGDGRIETAVLLFDIPLRTPPSLIWLTDPFNLSQVEKAPTLVAQPLTLTATMRSFSPGTGFPASNLARIGAEAGLFAEQNILMEDSVGPVLISARSFPYGGPGRSALEVEFSEPIADPARPVFPLDVKRSGTLLAPASIQAAGVTKLSPTRYRWEFEPGSKYPVPRDSLSIAAAAALSDAGGTISHMSFFIPVSGDPIRAQADIGITLVKGLTQAGAVNDKPKGAAVLVHGSGICLNCMDAAIKPLLPAHLPADLRALGPTWRVTSQFPFRYSLAVFDNLGQFVNRAEGSVSADRLALIPRGGGPDDSSRVELTLLPVAADGNSLATGAYIMKGEVGILDQPVHQGPQGEEMLIVPAGRTIVSRFGYMRQSGGQ